VAGTYNNFALGFAMVTADVGSQQGGGGQGDDRAWLYDTTGDDIFHGRVGSGELITRTARLLALGFNAGWAIAAMGNNDNDTAYLYTGTPWQILGGWEDVETGLSDSFEQLARAAVQQQPAENGLRRNTVTDEAESVDLLFQWLEHEDDDWWRSSPP
jgi:hypothetical protein